MKSFLVPKSDALPPYATDGSTGLLSCTTHILKPPTGEWGAFAENEHFCLRVAARLGLPVARSQVRRFEDEIAIVVERYDRIPVGDRIVRVHQEDLCQSLGVIRPTSTRMRVVLGYSG